MVTQQKASEEAVPALVAVWHGVAELFDHAAVPQHPSSGLDLGLSCVSLKGLMGVGRIITDISNNRKLLLLSMMLLSFTND